MSVWPAMLLLAALSSPSPTFWVERDGAIQRLSYDLTPLFDARLKRRLKSGLTTTLHLKTSLRTFDTDVVKRTTWRRARVRWDLWEERLTVVVDQPDGATAHVYTSLDPFLRSFAQLEDEPFGLAVPSTPTVYQIYTVLQVNPLNAAQQARVRQWLANGTPDPFRGTLLGSFVRFFDNTQADAAERTLRASGQPFRGDRLPHRPRGEHGAP